MVYWKAYVEALLGITVEDAQEKFDALCDTERAAWDAVANVTVGTVANAAKVAVK